MKIKKVEAQNQVLKNFIKAKGLDVEIKNNTERVKYKNINSYISRDLKFTIIYIVASVIFLISIKYLNLNLFLNKFF